ncbi:MAG: hypothetical protein AMXMBFR33_40780 [Candidatus Xenobia bacterium]
MKNSTEPEFSFVRGPFYRYQQRLGLIPGDGRLGIRRRALFYLLVGWLPVVIAAALSGRLFMQEGSLHEPLLAHFGVHVRCLVAIPCFLLAEMLMDQRTRLLLPEFKATGIIAEPQQEAYEEVLRRTLAWRNSKLSLCCVLAASLICLLLVGFQPQELDEISWTRDGGPFLSFSGWYYLIVTRFLFVSFAAVWAFRWVLSCVLFLRLSRLPLKLVPTHPDRSGGLGFLEMATVTLAPVLFGLSAVIAARWTHEILYHGLALDSLYFTMGLLVGLLVLGALIPMVAFVPPLVLLKRHGLLHYGALAARHGRLVQRRWLHAEEISPQEERLLQAQELGPVADVVSLFEAVERIRIVPLSRLSILPLAVAAALPMLVVIGTRIPLKEMFLEIIKALL